MAARGAPFTVMVNEPNPPAAVAEITEVPPAQAIGVKEAFTVTGVVAPRVTELLTKHPLSSSTCKKYTPVGKLEIVKS